MCQLSASSLDALPLGDQTAQELPGPGVKYNGKYFPTPSPHRSMWMCGLVTEDSDTLGASVGSTALCMTLRNLCQCSLHDLEKPFRQCSLHDL